ncbi:hypothetical protein [Blastopirellula retiformator]|nr:hypothetical protein [Blastopirellula retiformator]
MPIDFAHRLANLQADDGIQQRITILRAKSNQGMLSPDEDAEYKEMVEAIDVVSYLQAKAREVLAR